MSHPASDSPVIRLLVALAIAGAGAASAGAQPVVSPEPSSPAPGPGTATATDGDDGDGDERARRELIERAENRINLRLGVASSDDTGRPVVCMEVRAVSRLSIEGCGAGGGFLHTEPGSELAHFRAKWAVHRRVVRGGVLRGQVGLGFAELQIDADQPGFVLDPEPGGVEAVGPEASVGVQWLRPLGGGWELILNANASVAWVPAAGELRTPHDTWQPTVAFEIGAGW